MRCVPSARRYAGFTCLSVVLLLLHPYAAGAACNPASCDAVFDCGTRECIGLTCESFFEDAGTLCRSAAGVCDAAESCSGNSLSCPSNKKKSASTVCRTSTIPCDAAEHCDGASNDCPADGGAAPDVASIAIVTSTHRAGGIDLGRDASVEVTGTNLCSVRFGNAIFEDSLVSEGGLPATRMLLDRSYASPEALAADFPSGTYSFSLNDDAVAGTLPFTPGAPDGSLEILAPPTDSVLDGNPTFTISNHCSNCDLMRVSFENDGLGHFVASHIYDGLPIDTPLELTYLDMIEGASLLGEGHYEFHAESIDGILVPVQNFLGNPTDVFVYLSGTSLRDEVEFTVPEPAGWPSMLASVAALTACMRARARHGRRGASR
jgi:hypothetical protein